jgi:hypothetical protein
MLCPQCNGLMYKAPKSTSHGACITETCTSCKFSIILSLSQEERAIFNVQGFPALQKHVKEGN